jgi:hypothetical protein
MLDYTRSQSCHQRDHLTAVGAMVRGDMTSRQSRPSDQFGGAVGKYGTAATWPSPAGAKDVFNRPPAAVEANGRGDAAPGPESDDRPISVTVGRHAVDGARYDGSGSDRPPRSPDGSRPPSSQRSWTCGSSAIPDVCAYRVTAGATARARRRASATTPASRTSRQSVGVGGRSARRRLTLPLLRFRVDALEGCAASSDRLRAGLS